MKKRPQRGHLSELASDIGQHRGARMCDWPSGKQFCLCKIVQGTWFELNVPRGTFLIK